MSFEQRLKQKQFIEQQRNINEQQAEIFKGFATDHPTNPLWAIVAPIQAEFAKAEYDGQHGDHIVELMHNASDSATAAV